MTPIYDWAYIHVGGALIPANEVVDLQIRLDHAKSRPETEFRLDHMSRSETLLPVAVFT